MAFISELKFWGFLQQCPRKCFRHWPKCFVVFTYEYLDFFKVWIVRVSYLLSSWDATVFTTLHKVAKNNHQLIRQASILPFATLLSIAKTPYISVHDNHFSFCDSCYALRVPDLVMMKRLFHRHAWPGLFHGAMCAKTAPSDDNWRHITTCHSTKEQPNTRDYLFKLTWFIQNKRDHQILTCSRRSLGLSSPPTKSE